MTHRPVVVNRMMALARHETAADTAARAMVFDGSVGRGVSLTTSSKNLVWKKAASASLQI
jgi:hypothetical protein